MAEAEPILVVGAVIVRSGLLLCARRGPGPQEGLWEFPGGKVEPGETPAQALAREVREELGCSIVVEAPLTTTTHAYDHVTVELATYLCRVVAGEPRPHEHTSLLWASTDRLSALAWAPADLPAVEMLAREPAVDPIRQGLREIVGVGPTSPDEEVL